MTTYFSIEYKAVKRGHSYRSVPVLIVGPTIRPNKRKLVALSDDTNPPTFRRMDYPPAQLVKLGAKLPEFYYDPTGNLCRLGDGAVLFQA